MKLNKYILGHHFLYSFIFIAAEENCIQIFKNICFVSFLGDCTPQPKYISAKIGSDFNF